MIDRSVARDSIDSIGWERRRGEEERINKEIET